MINCISSITTRFHQKISQEDLKVMRDKFPMLNDFSEHFLQSRTLDELLRIESTSLRIRDAERAREAEERLAQNKSNLPTKFYEVRGGRDNRLKRGVRLSGC